MNFFEATMSPAVGERPSAWSVEKWRLLLMGMAMAMLGIAPLQAGRAAERLNQSGPLIIAHRGASGEAPENTLPAFRLALAARADLVELDYVHSADGVPVVIHDHTLDRTTDAAERWGKKIPVEARTLAELKQLEAGSWFKPAFPGTRLPTLVEALGVIQNGGCTLIERKAGDAAALVTLLRERDLLLDVVVQAFDWEFLKEARRNAPEMALGALGPPATLNGRELQREEKVLSREFVDLIAAIGVQVIGWNSQVTAEAIAYAHERGLRVWIYTINDHKEARRLVDLGADGIITDQPALIRRALWPEPDESGGTLRRGLPRPLPDHPGNIFEEGGRVRVGLPDGARAGRVWRLLDDGERTLRTGILPVADVGESEALDLGELGVGWYRVEFGLPTVVWTSAAVLSPWQAPVPFDSPVCVDSATSWFARDDHAHQLRLASLAALAGVNWVRDRMRWSEMQPGRDEFADGATTYDTAAALQNAAGLKVMQVFHDTPPWAREPGVGGGRFATDLRHVYGFARAAANRFRGLVQAWEPWNEANVATFGSHPVDAMCSWQKAAWLGFKQGDPGSIVGWNPTAAVPTPEHAEGVLANEVWPYCDTYNIHTYDWSHAYDELWGPARAASAGRPLWITEADRGTPHLKQEPFFDQDPALERLKAYWIAQSYAASLFAGSRRHFHFILGHYHEPNGVQFGLLRLDLTPRPAYPALAAVGRFLAGARILGRWRLGGNLKVYAFRARPDGIERDVLVVWAEREVDWTERGQVWADWPLPEELSVLRISDYLGRTVSGPGRVGAAPQFVELSVGQAGMLPLEPPPRLLSWSGGRASPVVLQLTGSGGETIRVEDRPWSEGYAHAIPVGQRVDLEGFVYNFAQEPVAGRLKVTQAPEDWEVSIREERFNLDPMGRLSWQAELRIPNLASVRDGWVRLAADCDRAGTAVLAFRILGR